MCHGGPDAAFARLADVQHGVVGRVQARDCGMTPRMLEHRVNLGRLNWISPNVLRVCGAPRTWHQDLQAAVLEVSPHGVASHRAAGILHYCDTFGPRCRRYVEVTLTRRNRRAALDDGVIRHTSLDLEDEDIVTVDGIRCTSLVRTLGDLGSVVPMARLEHAVDGALRDGRTHPAELEAFLRRVRRRGRRGVAALDRVLTARGLVLPQSVLERQLLRRIEQAGLPIPVTQLHVLRPDGVDAYLDFAYPDHQVGIEVDGHASHATRAQRAADAERANQLALTGWTLIRFTYEDVRDRPGPVLATIRKAIRSPNLSRLLTPEAS